tara:strand:- start:13 stop:324 length:312 start_codon:yes stop_codon:yes gene_type:complete
MTPKFDNMLNEFTKQYPGLTHAQDRVAAHKALPMVQRAVNRTFDGGRMDSFETSVEDGDNAMVKLAAAEVKSIKKRAREGQKQLRNKEKAAKVAAKMAGGGVS